MRAFTTCWVALKTSNKFVFDIKATVQSGEVAKVAASPVAHLQNLSVKDRELDGMLIDFGLEKEVPERDLAALRARGDLRNVPVRVSAREGGAPMAEGRLTFVDNAVDPATGTISLKGTFANPNRALWPGEFVNVAMTVSNRAAAVVIPAQAVQTSQQYVYVVKEGNAVEMRPVTVAQQVEQQAIIDRGVSPGETVVTDGQIRLTPKSKVDVKTSL